MCGASIRLGVPMSPSEKLCLALDFPEMNEALAWVERTCEHVCVFKIGLELFCAEGLNVIREVKRAGASKIFLDLKLHDIPRTVGRAVGRLRRLGVDYLTIHTAGGAGMMSEAVENAGDSLALLGVTVLTSMDADELKATGTDPELTAVVERRGRLALEHGVKGLVCSALEVKHLRHSFGSDCLLVTPGIRRAGHIADDQRRIMTPRAALEAGSSLLVLGRTVTQADNPEAALNDIIRAVRT